MITIRPSLPVLLSVCCIFLSREVLPGPDDQSRNRIVEQDQAYSFGDFPPETRAEEELEAMLGLPESDIDLALANWLIVADLPPFEDMTREEYSTRIRRFTAHSRSVIQRAKEDPDFAGPIETPEQLCYIFCCSIISLGIEYNEEFKKRGQGAMDVREQYRDANNIFLPGLCRTGKGSCVTMPMLYLVIGQRFGFPVYMVTVGQHAFIRWDQPEYRINIETTIVDKVALTPDEDFYLENENLTREKLRGTNDLKNLNKYEVIALLLNTRSGWYRAQGDHYAYEFWRDLYRAHHIDPRNRIASQIYDQVMRLRTGK